MGTFVLYLKNLLQERFHYIIKAKTQKSFLNALITIKKQL